MLATTCKRLKMDCQEDVKIWFDVIQPQQVDNFVCGAITTLTAAYYAQADGLSEALKTGNDYIICGDCIYSKLGICYVNVR